MIYKIQHTEIEGNIKWTSIRDVGEDIDGHILIWDEYRKVEDQYILLINNIFNVLYWPLLKPKKASFRDEGDNFYSHDEFKYFDPSKIVKKGNLMSRDEVMYFARWALREVCSFYVTFDSGFIICQCDYNLYISVDIDLIDIIKDAGLHYQVIDTAQLEDEVYDL